jgi:hypothetical protein
VLAFSENVAASLTLSDLVLKNLTTDQTIAAGDLVLTYRVSSNSAKLSYSGTSNGALPDGDYELKLSAGSVTDDYGNTNLNDTTFNFFALAGDATRDRNVNIEDFSALAANFNSPGTFSLGDFNYNGTTEISDFSILAAGFNTGLAAARPAATPQASAVTTAKSVPTGVFGTRTIGENFAGMTDRLDELLNNGSSPT